jgi:hypothetical protein
VRVAWIVVLAACERAPAPKPFATLSADELDRACERIEASRRATEALPDSKQQWCRGEALAAAGAPDKTTASAMSAACTKELKDCLDKPRRQVAFDCKAFTAQLVKCGDLTPDDLEACSDEMRSGLPAAAKADVCAAAFDPKDSLREYHRYLDSMKGAKCAVVTTKCKPSGAR